MPLPQATQQARLIWSSTPARWLLNISVKPCVRVEVDEMGRECTAHPLMAFFLLVLSLCRLLPEILPQFSLESERIGTGNPWPDSPIQPTLRRDPDSGCFARSCSEVPRSPAWPSRVLEEKCTGAPGETRFSPHFAVPPGKGESPPRRSRS